MKIKYQFSAVEIIVVIIIILIFISMVFPVFINNKKQADKIKANSVARSIGLTLIAYAEDDIKNFKLPYPLPRGKEKIWGNSKECWSTSVAQMLFEKKYMKLGEEWQLKNPYQSNQFYKPMYLDDNTKHKNEFWKNRTELDFQIFCNKDLTSNLKNKTILVATYDNENIRDCQFNGTGWVVFYSDFSTEFIKRKKYINYDEKTQVNPNTDLKADEILIKSKGLVLRKDIPEDEGGPGTFGNHLGGGSTELMGKKTTDAVYKALVK